MKNNKSESSYAVLRTEPSANYLGMSVSWFHECRRPSSPYYDSALPAAIALGKRARGFRVCDLDAFLDAKVVQSQEK